MAAAVDTGHQFGSIFLGQRGSVGQGQLKINPAGFVWRRNGGGKSVEIKKPDIDSLHWTKVTRGCQLGVRVKEGATTNFIGFKDKDLEALRSYCNQQFGVQVQELALSTSGRNWGAVALNGKSMMFMVDGKVAFEVPLPDVAQAQQVKDDVMLEFHVDDDGGGEREDALMELALHVPPQHKDLKQEGVEDPPAKLLLDSFIQYTDTGGAATDSPAAHFTGVHVIAPRGRFDIEMNLNQMQLVGQAQDFKIRYTSIQRIFILPKTSTPHTLVVISLEPPIRKGQTYYTHILCQFSTDEEASIDLDITPEALAAKNEKVAKNGNKLEASMSGQLYEVFARVLRGLSGARITKAGAFKNATGDGYAVRCSYKADDGYLYPLDKAFFYIQKPPMLITFDDVDSVELTRLGGNAVSSKTFDLVVRTKTDQEHQFRGIQRNEWQVLLDFFQAKKLRVERLREAQAGPAAGGRPAMDFGDEDEGGLLGMGDDSEDEDEDFDAAAHESSESSDGDLDASEDGAQLIDEEGISAKAVGGKSKPAKEAAPKKRPSEDEPGGQAEEKPAKKPKASPAAKKEKPAKEPKADAETGKKKRAKKDPNAPKGAISAFMYFSQAMRDKIKADNPDVGFGEIAKLVGEKWKAAAPEEKAPFEEKAKADKERYQREMAAFKANGGGAGDAGGDAEGGDE